MKKTATLLLALGFAPAITLAAPTLQIKGGQTSFVPSEAAFEAFTDCDVERVKPGHVKPGVKRIRFPISGGALDMEGLTGEIEHKGGVLLSCTLGMGKQVELHNFRLDLPETETETEAESEVQAPVISALATVDGTLVGRIAMFTPGGDAFTSSVNNGGLVLLSDVSLILTDEGANFLNEQLDITSLSEGMDLGQSSTRLKVRKEDRDDDDDDSESESSESSGKGKALGKDKNKDKDDDDDDDEEESEEEEESEDD